MTSDSNDKPVRPTIFERLDHMAVRLLVGFVYLAAVFFRRVRNRRPVPEGSAIDVLLTGTFHSDSWVDAFIEPLVASDRCRSIILVATSAVAQRPGVELIQPAKFTRKIFGSVLSRLLTFLRLAATRRFDLIGGFYIAPNALFADLAASINGARSLYICVGGPNEIADGGTNGESRILGRLSGPDTGIENLLLKGVKKFDAVVSMGRGGAKWFASRGVDQSRIHRITGAVHAVDKILSVENRPVDLLFVGRLVEIKDLELLLRAVRRCVDSGVQVSLRIVGRGPEESRLKNLTIDLEIEDYVEFAGFVDDVNVEYRKAKCFVLTSKSEGVSLAMLEAMVAGAVPVVADVGDLGDIVRDGENGHLVESREPQDFADAFCNLVTDQSKLSDYSLAAYNTGVDYSIHRVSDRWSALIDDVCFD